MKVLLVSVSGDGVWYVWLLLHGGHDVDWLCGNDKYKDALAGIIPRPLEHVADPVAYDLIVFDQSGLGGAADYARESAPTIGSSKFADKLENDRIFGLKAMEEVGIRVPPWQAFDSPADAIRLIKKTKRRYVFKPEGKDVDASLTYVSRSDEDMLRYIDVLFRRVRVKEFALQEFIEGIEISTEGWWNGQDWFAVNHTLEEKKFMAGGVGPNTGCSGNVIWMPPRPTPVFERGLAKVSPILQRENFVGPLDLNAIVTEGELYGLEWTPRFGYEGTCNLTRLLPMEFGQFMYEIATGGTPALGEPRAKFAATIRATVPPYPNKGVGRSMPVHGIELDKLDTFYVSGIRRKGDGEEIETDEKDALIGCPIGVGETIKQAFEEVKQAIGRIQIPDLQWRVDVPERCAERHENLLAQGWLRPLG